MFPLSSATGLALVIGYDRISEKRSWFSRWPVPATQEQIAVAIIGYVGVVALASIIGIILNDLTSSLGPALVISGIATVWFFKHLYFVLAFEDEPHG